MNTLAESDQRYPTAHRHAFLFSLGDGWCPLYDAATEGGWVVTDKGVELAEGEATEPEELNADVTLPEAAVAEATITLERDMEASLAHSRHQLEPGLRLYNSGDAVVSSWAQASSVGSTYWQPTGTTVW